MSYPDLGCFAECLACELCDDSASDDDAPGGDDGGFDPFDFGDMYEGDGDGDGVPDWADPDWGPEPSDGGEGGLFDDAPTGIPFGEGEMRPTWDPYGVEFHWEF